jgi:hypothetical protein
VLTSVRHLSPIPGVAHGGGGQTTQGKGQAIPQGELLLVLLLLVVLRRGGGVNPWGTIQRGIPPGGTLLPR